MRYQPSTRRLMAPVSATRQHSQILAKPSLPSVEGGHALAFSIGAYLELLPIKTIPTPEDSSVVPHVRDGGGLWSSRNTHAASLALVVRVVRMTFDFLMNLFAGNRYSAYTQTISQPIVLSSALLHSREDHLTPLNPNDPPDSCCFFKVSQDRLRVLVADCVKVGAEGSVCRFEVYGVKTPDHSIDFRAKA